MSEAVEILAPTSVAKVKRAFGTIKKTIVVSHPSKVKRERLLVAWLSDLDVVKRRNALAHAAAGALVGHVAVVLIRSANENVQSYEALQALLRWATVPSFHVAPDVEAVRRMVRARLSGAERSLISSATLDGDTLTVWSCEPKRFAVRVSEVPALASMAPKDLANFTVSKSGSRIHWDQGDVDLNLDSFRYYADPEAKHEQDKARREDATKYADAIRRFREERGLTQEAIAGLTDRQVRRLERGENTPQTGTLRKLASAHGLGLDEYMAELAERYKTAT